MTLRIYADFDAESDGRMASKQNRVDDYLANVPEPARSALHAVRKTIQTSVPDADEVINYGVPMFRQGKNLVGFGATGSHCAFYVMSPLVLERFRSGLEGFEVSKGTIRFQPERPLPAALIKKIVRARLKENADLAT